MAADRLALLARGLDDAAVALHADLTDDAARQHVWSLLGSNAQVVLRALCAAGEAPAVSTATVPAASRPRTARGLARFPEDVLGAIIAFVDLPMRFTCVAACSTLRDACARQSPRLEHSLLAKRFPLLRSFSNIGTAPSELFRTFNNFEWREGRNARTPDATINLDAYTLSLQLDILQRTRMEDGTLGPWRTLETVYVGTGTRSCETTAKYQFTIPPGLYERIDDAESSILPRLKASIVASRRIGGNLQFAKLWEGGYSDWDDGWAHFERDELHFDRGNAALNFLKARHDETEMWEDPFFEFIWRPDVDDNAGRPSIAEARFKWHTINDSEDMTVHDARCCLEHYAAWSE